MRPILFTMLFVALLSAWAGSSRSFEERVRDTASMPNGPAAAAEDIIRPVRAGPGPAPRG